MTILPEPMTRIDDGAAANPYVVTDDNRFGVFQMAGPGSPMERVIDSDNGYSRTDQTAITDRHLIAVQYG